MGECERECGGESAWERECVVWERESVWMRECVRERVCVRDRV